jgi:protein SCO1/2
MFSSLRIRNGNAARALALSVLVVAAPRAVASVDKLPPALEGVTIDEKLGTAVDLDLQFVNESGYEMSLRQYFSKGKPVILNLVYYNCPMLCNLVLNGQVDVLREIPWTAGEEFEIVTISIDPMENWGLAARKKHFYMEAYGRPAHQGWHFLTDYKGNVKRLAEQIGFRYRWDDRTEQFAHAAALMVLTPDGRMSRYLYGIKHRPRNMRLALTEASEGKLGSIGDKLLMFCFHYDPAARSYVPFARNIMRGGGVLTILILGGILLYLFNRDRTRPVPDQDSELVTAK